MRKGNAHIRHSGRLHHGGEDVGRPAWLGLPEPLGSYWRPSEIRQTGAMTAAEVMQAFARAWNTDDDAGRLRLLAAACVPDGVFVAPQGTLTGIDALCASIGEFRRAFPAAAVVFGHPDEHGGFVRVAWVTHWNTGQPDLAGEDFGELSADGRIKLLASFDGAPQPAS